MTVFLSDDEINTFGENGISEAQIQDTVNQYRVEGVSDEEIRAKIDDKLSKWNIGDIKEDKTQSINTPAQTPTQKPSTNSLPLVQDLKVEPPKQTSSDEEFLSDYNEAAQDEASKIWGYTPYDPNKPLEGKATYNYNSYEDIQNNQNLSKDEKIKAINSLAEEERKKIDDENFWKMAKLYGGAGLEIGSAFIPVGAGARIGAAGIKLAKPIAGQVIKNLAKRGAIEGLASGAVFGAGRGLMEDKNLAETILQDATLGGAGGAGISALGGKLATSPLAAKILDNAGDKIGGKAGNFIKSGGNLSKRVQNIENRALERATRPDILPDLNQTDLKLLEKNKNNLQDFNPSSETAERAGVATIRKHLGDEVANSLTDTDYTIRGRDINKAEFESLTPAHQQRLISDPEDLSDLATYAKSEYIKNEIANGKVPQGVINSWLKGGTEKAQALQAQKFLAPETTEGAVVKTIKAIKEAQPKHVQKLLDATDDIAQKVGSIKNLSAEQKVTKIDNMLKPYVVQKSTRKVLSDRIIELEDLGGLNSENLTTLINKKYNIPELDTSDIQNISQITANIRNAANQEEKEVAVGLLGKYIVNKLPKSGQDRLNAYRVFNMLFSPISRITDTALTGVYQAEQALNEGVANVVSKAITKPLRGVKTRSGYHFDEWYKGLKKGAKQGARDVKLGIETGRAGEGARFDLPRGEQFSFTPWDELSKTSASGMDKIKKGLENIFAMGEKGLNYSIRVSDRAYYEARYASSIADQMKAQGLTEPTKDIIEQAVKEAREAIFQDDSWASKTAKTTRDALNMLPTGKFKVGDWTTPFVTTVANVTNSGLKNTVGLPVGAAKLLMAKTPQELRDAEMLIGKGVIGAGIGGSYAALRNNDVASTNAGNMDYIRQNEELSQGIRPQSLTIGGYNIGLKNLPQASIPIATTEAILKAYEDRDWQQGLLGATAAPVSAVLDMPAFKGVGDLTKGIMESMQYMGEDNKDKAEEAATRAFLNTGTNYLTQLVPASGILGTARNITDPYQRETYSESLSYPLDRIGNRLPFVSQNLPIKYDVTGKPLKTSTMPEAYRSTVGSIADFMQLNKVSDDPVIQEIQALKKYAYENDIAGKSNLKFDKPSRKVKFPNGDDKIMNNKAYSRYMKNYNAQYYNSVKELINNTEYWQNMSDENKVEKIGEIRRRAKAYADEKLFNIPNKKKYKGSMVITRILENNKVKE